MAGRTKSLKVLLVEDGADVARVIEVGLIKAGFRVDWVTSGEEALNRVNNGGIGLVLLDVGLPGIDGHTVCRRIRSHPTRSKLPIIMLTSLSAEEDIVVGLETGADDYVTKPFSAVELVARVQAIMRRVGATSTMPTDAKILTTGALKIDPKSHTVVVDGEGVAVTLAEFRLLFFLMSHPGQAFSRGELLPNVVGEGVHVIDRNIDVHVRNLRKKLAEHVDGIVTVRGIGYRFEPPIR